MREGSLTLTGWLVVPVFPRLAGIRVLIALVVSLPITWLVNHEFAAIALPFNPAPNCSSNASTEWQNSPAALRPFKEIRPGLHHLGAWRQVEGVVVRGANRVAWCVRELQLGFCFRRLNGWRKIILVAERCRC